MKSVSSINLEINKIFKKAFKNKPKGHHDPLFLGNEKKYLNKCISSGYVSYVGKFVNLFEKNYLNTPSPNSLLLLLQVLLHFI